MYALIKEGVTPLSIKNVVKAMYRKWNLDYLEVIVLIDKKSSYNH